MGQEFFINSQTLQDKIRTALPSQGGAGAGLDLSASTTIVPIIDLTESSEGSTVRQDLQTALSFNNITNFEAQNNSSVIISNTGYFRIFGNCFQGSSSTTGEAKITITDGSTTKSLWEANNRNTGVEGEVSFTFDFIAFLGAGDSVSAFSDSLYVHMNGLTRQIATIDGELVDVT
jgi:hypothetical protein